MPLWLTASRLSWRPHWSFVRLPADPPGQRGPDLADDTGSRPAGHEPRTVRHRYAPDLNGAAPASADPDCDRLARATPVTIWAFRAKSENALRARCRHRSESWMASKYNLPHVEA